MDKKCKELDKPESKHMKKRASTHLKKGEMVSEVEESTSPNSGNGFRGRRKHFPQY